MKNLKKLTKRNLKEINGGVGNYCPPPANWCAQWCTWTTWQKEHCLNAVVDEPCNC